MRVMGLDDGTDREVGAAAVAQHGRIRIGWLSAAVELLRQKPLRCFRCLETVHVLARCLHEEDWSGLCYRCGVPDVRRPHTEWYAQRRYLGLDLDSRWSFRAHFRNLVPRLMAAAGALSWLLPNVRGPGEGSRRLYLGVVRSMALYGAPIWVGALGRENVACLNRPHRAMAIRAIRGYRTISGEAAGLLAGSPPWDLVAELHASV
ncbi:uncharacterized protein LOC131841705, partial [Achroia grisella]|uniref:uncharacterized protein LOC131841705 n=1 Tax=Achroia grisella TaxID=688607 RepID=UPI0027D2496D